MLKTRRASRMAHCLIAALGTTCVLAAAPARADTLPVPISRVLDSLDIPYENVSVLIRELGADEPLLSYAPEIPRNPASVMKVVTTWTALDVLGPAYTWPTEVYFLGDFDGSTLHGDLAIKGYGDPFLVLEHYWNMLRQLRRTGLREIEGDLVLDSTYFDIPEQDPGAFDGQPYRTYNVVPNALLVNFKAVQFFFLADPFGRRVQITVDPDLPNLEVRNRLTLDDGPCRGYQGGISFNISDPETIARAEFDGAFPARCNSYSFSRTVLQHDTYAYGLFRSLWRDLGGTLQGQLVNAPVPEDATRVLTWRSPPLAEVIRSINKNSNNVMTRQLLLTLGAEFRGVPGTQAGGVDVVHEHLDALGLHDGSLVIVNGAGLSRESRVSATMLTNVLQAAARDVYAPEFMASLSIGGLDGTTRGRYDDAQGNGVMHLKTGSMDHVSALAGYVHADDGRIYTLVVITNTPEAHRGLGREVEEAVLGWLQTQI